MKKRIKLLSWMLLMVMLIGLTPAQINVYASTADQAVKHASAVLTQKENEIKPGGIINSEEDLSVQVSFHLSEFGLESQTLQGGATATINLTNDFVLISEEPALLTNKGLPVGQVNIERDTQTKELVAKVTLDNGDEELLESFKTDFFDFEFNMKYDTADDAGLPGDHAVTVVDEEYQVIIESSQTDDVNDAELKTELDVNQPDSELVEDSQEDVTTTKPEAEPEDEVVQAESATKPQDKPAHVEENLATEIEELETGAAKDKLDVPANETETVSEEEILNEDALPKLENISSVVRQDGKVVEEGGTLNSEEPISLEVHFDIPVEGDEPTPENPVRKGDTAVFVISNAFNVPTPSSIELKNGDTLVGTVVFSTNDDGEVIATVTFDGDDEVFDGTYNSVAAEFSAEFDYDDSGDAGNVGDHLVSILDKEYTINVPPLPIEYKVEKSGDVDLSSGKITWTVTVTATQGEEQIDLEGYQFVDNLKNVGEFVEGSFKVNGANVAPSTTLLTYVFPGGSLSPQTITFETKISDNKLYESKEQSIGNTAQLKLEDETLKEGKSTVKFTPQWISKKGEASAQESNGVYDPTNRTITWTITANLSDL
ncbi:MAG: hypothetical protein GX833_07635, partial [Clostridium sp.]|nr:hypothetical protein [Clostridium sp.]